jgi:regulator of protease activity HflC (stomatin/prohibitin superfamily)
MWGWLVVGVLVLFLLTVGYYLYLEYIAFRVFTYIMIGIALLIVLFKFFVRKYDEYERAVIFRLGRFNRIAGPGWAIVLPFFEKEFAKLDVRTHMSNIYVPMAFTKDDLRLEIDGFAYYRIVNPQKAVLEIENYRAGLQNLLISETRSTIGSMSMREVFANLDRLNDILAERVRHMTWKWGIDVPQVQIRRVAPPVEIAIAMQQKTIAAERLQAQRFLAEARKIAIEAIGEGARALDDRAVMYLYIKALEELGKGQATKMIFPMQFFDVLRDVGKEIGKGVAGINIDEAIDAIKKKILEAKIT